MMKSEIFFYYFITLSLEIESAFITRLHYVELENSFSKIEILLAQKFGHWGKPTWFKIHQAFMNLAYSYLLYDI